MKPFKTFYVSTIFASSRDESWLSKNLKRPKFCVIVHDLVLKAFNLQSIHLSSYGKGNKYQDNNQMGILLTTKLRYDKRLYC
jgi:hypothetical protein